MFEEKTIKALQNALCKIVTLENRSSIVKMEKHETHRIRRVRTIVMKESLGRRMNTKQVTYKPKGLQCGPRVGVKLGQSHIEHLKDTHCELVKRKCYVQVCEKRRRINIKEGSLRP